MLEGAKLSARFAIAALLAVSACAPPAVAPVPASTRADAVGSVLVGAPGARGATGAFPSGGGFLTVDGDVVSLSAQACSEGQLLKASGGAWSCGSDDGASANSLGLVAGSGVMVSPGGSSATLSASPAPTFSAGDHDHFGQTWSGGYPIGLKVENQRVAPSQPSDEASGVVGVGAAEGYRGLRAGVRGEARSDDWGVAVVGASWSQAGGRGVLGDADGPGSRGLYGEVDSNDPSSAGLYGEAVRSDSWAVVARNRSGGTALQTSGAVVFDRFASVSLPITVRVSADAAGRMDCNAGEVAIGGGCGGLPGIRVQSSCLANGDCCKGDLGCNIKTPPTSFRCITQAGGNYAGKTFVQCLKVN